MKQVNISIHPFSALVGMAVLSMAWVTAAAMPLQGSSSDRDVSAIEVVSDPHPREDVRVLEGAPFTVPTGKIFVPTALGATQWPNNGGGYYADYRVRVNGNEVWRELKQARHYSSFWGHAPNEMSAAVPRGLSFAEQSIVEVREANSGVGILLGYLVDA